MARFGVGYHVEFAGQYYSVPAQSACAQLNLRVTRTTDEIFQRGRRIASHVPWAFKAAADDCRRALTGGVRRMDSWNVDTLTAPPVVRPRFTVPVEKLLNQRRNPSKPSAVT